MSWMSVLSETYDNVSRKKISDLGPQLYPIAHTTQNAQIELWISEDAEFIEAKVLEDKAERKTLIPCTEASASKVGIHPAAHPLFDKLMYLAGDYIKYGGEKGEAFHQKYMEQLEDWCKSKEAHRYVKIVHQYLKQGRLIEDLVNYGIICCDKDTGKALEKWSGDKNETPPVFKALVSTAVQLDAFVRIGIEEDFERIPLWLNKDIQESFIRYYISKQGQVSFCYVTGEKVPCSVNHPKKIRNDRDQAKLISANDKKGFTYRGRFEYPEEAVQISYEVSQKAHNAFKWLREKQGIFCGSKVIIAWGTQDDELPEFSASTEVLLGIEEETYADTEEEFAARLGKSIYLYEENITPTSKVAIMAVDSATPGRLSITFYREYMPKQIHGLLENIKNWHEQCAWPQGAYQKGGKKYIGVPALRALANFIYGVEHGELIKADDKVVALTVQRLLSCVIDGRNIPGDIVRALYYKAITPQKYNNVYNWDKVRKAACSLIKKRFLEKGIYKEECNLAVNKESKNYSYNCGRMLAVAHLIEAQALWMKENRESSKSEDNKSYMRETNAKRYMTKYAEAPCKTWMIIRKRLAPYEKILVGKTKEFEGMMGEIVEKISVERFQNNEKLDGCMLLGYDAQIKEYWDTVERNKKNKGEKKEDK